MGILDKVLFHAKRELQLNAEYYKRQQEERRLLSPKRPVGSISAKTKGELLLIDAKHRAAEINRSETFEDFEMSFTKLVDSLQQLMWINEKANISMFGLTPRKNLERILSNMEATINDFIERARRRIVYFGKNQAEEYESLAQEIENSNTFCAFLTPLNRENISLLHAEAEKLRKEQYEAEQLQKQAEEEKVLQLRAKAEKLKKEQYEAEQLQKRKEEERELKRKNQAMLNEIGKTPIDLTSLDAMEVIVAMEAKISLLYKLFLDNTYSPEQGKKLFLSFRDACQSSTLPLAAEVRLESLLAEYEPRFSDETPMYAIDHMEGHDFEQWCAALLKKNGYTNIEITQGSNDQGVDIVATNNDIRYAIQCKCYSSDLGNTPVQEVHTGKAIYRCHVGVVMTNRYFTAGAKQAAEATGTLL